MNKSVEYGGTNMETIKIYIENLFQNLPATEATIRAKEELLGMMEDKYNELKLQGKSENEAIGIVISEFGNIDELKEELGIKNPIAASQTIEKSVDQDETLRRITLSEVEDFLVNTSKFARKIALGVTLCIFSIIQFILLAGWSGSIDCDEKTVKGMTGYAIHVSSLNAMEATGLVLLFVFIAIAVAIFIINGIQYQKYEYIKKEKFAMDAATVKYVAELKESYRTTFSIKITLGVVLCITSVIPVILAGILCDESNSTFQILSVAMLLGIIAVAVILFVTAGIRMDSYKQLLQEEEYSPSRKIGGDLTEKIASIYWPVVIAGYLAWSFITDDWGKTWIVWPVAGVLFGGISAICSSFSSDKNGRK